MTASVNYVNTDLPATDAVSITPNDSTVLSPAPRALYINGAGGTLTVITVAGTTIQFTVVTGQILPLAVQTVKATGTAATGIIGLI